MVIPKVAKVRQEAVVASRWGLRVRERADLALVAPISLAVQKELLVPRVVRVRVAVGPRDRARRQAREQCRGM